MTPLLQGVQALMLNLQAVADRLRSESAQASQLIEQALARADAVLAEGRDRIKDLRTVVQSPHDWAQFFLRIAEEAPPHAIKVRVTLEGSMRELRPQIRDSVEKIAMEAIRNVRRHAKASTIDIGILFHRRQFALRISDDGVGIDPAVLSMGRERHFGLAGMRERAGSIGGQICIASRCGGGTEVELVIPARIAY